MSEMNATGSLDDAGYVWRRNPCRTSRCRDEVASKEVLGIVGAGLNRPRALVVLAMQRHCVSYLGVNQFLNGQMVMDPTDRSKIAGLVILRFAPPIGNKGSLAGSGRVCPFALKSPDIW